MVKRIYWRVLRVLGFKQLSWDQQYKEGMWQRMECSPHTLMLINKLVEGGRILQFGCGTGDLVHVLPASVYSHYLGIDISSAAIEKARKLADQAGLAKCAFEVGSMESWKGSLDPISLILLEECLYYLNGSAMKEFLVRCYDSLDKNGKLLVIVHDAKKHAKTLEICRNSVYPVSDLSNIEGRTYLTLGKSV
jgi:cyclopropane fatty-acyl-phospholipid synthase-like methyltransferase